MSLNSYNYSEEKLEASWRKRPLFCIHQSILSNFVWSGDCISTFCVVQFRNVSIWIGSSIILDYIYLLDGKSYRRFSIQTALSVLRWTRVFSNDHFGGFKYHSTYRGQAFWLQLNGKGAVYTSDLDLEWSKQKLKWLTLKVEQGRFNHNLDIGWDQIISDHKYDVCCAHSPLHSLPGLYW